MNKTNFKIIFLLHLLLMLFSVSGIFSKLASAEAFLSIKWCLCYGGVILLLGIYAIGWQQIIKRMPLTAAYANKAVTTVWGLVWGVLFFRERITLGKIIGVILVVIGVALFGIAEAGEIKVESENANMGETEDKEVLQ